MQSVMTHNFSNIPSAEIQRSSFDRSHGHKTTFDAGYLVPIYIDEALPGDTFNMNMSLFARLSTQIKPIMDNLYLDSFFFAVPYRLVWDNWEKFNGAQDNPGDSTDFYIPQMRGPNYASGGVAVGSLSDYFGIPTGPLDATNGGIYFNSLFHRAYNLIWNTWFRDENLQNSVVVDKGNGPDTYSNYTLLKRGKRHDYFTSCLPWPQKGPDVPLPLGTTATVKRLSNATYVDLYNSGNDIKATANKNILTAVTQAGALAYDTGGGLNAVSIDPRGGLYADLTTATAATINSLRQAFQLQKLYERDARGGTRYTEIIKSHFGVTSPDARLQRPEYLGGGTAPINIHAVAQTSEGTTTKQGNLASFGTTSVNNHSFTKSFTEHCLIIGMVSARADLTYQRGLNKMFTRRTRVDHYWPAFANIGEQSVLSKEIYCDGTANDDLVFGYQERYAEYRYKPSLITGKFRSNYATSLDVWHLSQDFGTSRPTLGSTFIQETPPMARIKAVSTEPDFILDSFFNLKCARPMPTYSVPGLIDHF